MKFDPGRKVDALEPRVDSKIAFDDRLVTGSSGGDFDVRKKVSGACDVGCLLVCAMCLVESPEDGVLVRQQQKQ